MTKIKIDVPAMEIGVFAQLVMKGVHSPKDLLDSLVFWSLHFLENAPESMGSVAKENHLVEAIDQMETTLKPLAGFHDVEYQCIIKMFKAEMTYHIFK